MRTYDYADDIWYVRLGEPALPTEPHVQDDCRRLPADYANVCFWDRIVEPRTARARPALVLHPGETAAVDSPVLAASAAH